MKPSNLIFRLLKLAQWMALIFVPFCLSSCSCSSRNIYEVPPEEVARTSFNIQDAVSSLLTCLTHIIIVICILLMISAAWYLIKEAPSKIDGLIRIMAVMIGFLAYVLSKSGGLSLPETVAKSFSFTSPLMLIASAYLVPGFLGLFIAWFILKHLKSGNAIPKRVVLLIVSFIVMAFTDVYSYVASRQMEQISSQSSYIPNIAFVIGLGLYVIFKGFPNEK